MLSPPSRVVKKVIAADSFFNFFSPPTPPTEEALESGDFEEDDLAALDERLELDYQVGEDFKEKIIPRAVDFYTGKVSAISRPRHRAQSEVAY